MLHHELIADKFNFASGTADPKIWDEISREDVWTLWVFNLKTGTAKEFLASPAGTSRPPCWKAAPS